MNVIDMILLGGILVGFLLALAFALIICDEIMNG